MRRDESDRAQWLLIKHRDEMADADYDVVASVTTSVASGRSMEAIAARKGRVWNSNRSDSAEPRSQQKRAAATKRAPAKKSRAKAAKRATKRTTSRSRG
jgi:bifunctional non-homologous end joining protein LigD